MGPNPFYPATRARICVTSRSRARYYDPGILTGYSLVTSLPARHNKFLSDISAPMTSAG